MAMEFEISDYEPEMKPSPIVYEQTHVFISQAPQGPHRRWSPTVCDIWEPGLSEVNDPSKEVKVMFMRKSGQYFLQSKKLEKWLPKSTIFQRCTEVPSIDRSMRYSFDAIDIKGICDKIKTSIITHLAGQTYVWHGCKWNFAGPQIYL